MNKVGGTLMHFGPNKALVEAFLAESVDFILVGGLAVAWYCSDREPDDMDLLVNPTQENSARVHRALNRLGLTGHSTTSFDRVGVQAPLKATLYAEILTPQKGGVPYSEVDATAIEGSVFDLPVRIASATTLIAMKQLAAASAEKDQAKHRADIERLRAHAA